VKAIVEKWCSLPESERPDAMVLGFGSYVAQELEFALRAQGITIGDSEGKIMMVGIDYSRGELVYGRGWVFPSTRSDTLAQALVSNLLIPILKGDPPTEPVCRILPKLVRMPPPLIGNDYHE